MKRVVCFAAEESDLSLNRLGHALFLLESSF
jgi:hypothetical protein